jgi:thiamine-phosphate pyrophosphorylase
VSEDGPWIDAEEAPSGLLLMAPELPGPAFLDSLSAALATGTVLAFVTGPRAGDWEAARRLCRERQVACLALDSVASARSLGADGLHLGDPAGVAPAREAMGAAALIGAECGSSRHAAMIAGEAGADYVLFRAGDRDASLVELCRWWSELFVLPCAAAPEDGEEGVAPLVAAGVDLIAARELVWDHPDGVEVAARRLAERIATGQRQRQDG